MELSIIMKIIESDRRDSMEPFTIIKKKEEIEGVLLSPTTITKTGSNIRGFTKQNVKKALSAPQNPP